MAKILLSVESLEEGVVYVHNFLRKSRSFHFRTVTCTPSAPFKPPPFFVNNNNTEIHEREVFSGAVGLNIMCNLL
jgi:hypothetical protein